MFFKMSQYWLKCPFVAGTNIQFIVLSMIQSNLDAFKNQSKKNVTNREEYFIMQIILTCLFPLFFRWFRYVNCCQFVWWIWHRLGSHKKEILPACVFTSIRTKFPSYEYTGLKYPKIKYQNKWYITKGVHYVTGLGHIYGIKDGI